MLTILIEYTKIKKLKKPIFFKISNLWSFILVFKWFQILEDFGFGDF